MMKKLFACLLALALALGCTAGLAETSSFNLDYRNVDVAQSGENLIVYDGSAYYLADANGQKITKQGFASIYESSDYGLYRVTARNSVDGVHNRGVMNANGEIVVPMLYGKVEVISTRWVAGMKYADGDTSKDPSSVDIYYKGSLVGTLDGSQYYFSYGHGDYVAIRGKDTSYVHYNKNFEISPYAVSGSSEYDSKYSNRSYTYYHQGSGQKAFVPGCTLTDDEVECNRVVVNGQVLDLQGNVVANLAQNYDYISAYFRADDYARVQRYGKYGRIRISDGAEVIAPTYNELSYSYVANDLLPGGGLIYAVQDEKGGFVLFNGAIGCNFPYANSAISERSPFATVKDLSGGYIVLSGLVGELPGRFKDISVRSNCPVFCATDNDGNKGLIGLNGETLIPFEDDHSVYFNRQGTLAVRYLGYGNGYRVYHIDPADPYRLASAPAPAGNDPEPELPAEDGTWTCSNGHTGNTGKFCPECGEPRPVLDVTCPGCGTVYPAGSVPKFCPECGTKLQ